MPGGEVVTDTLDDNTGTLPPIVVVVGNGKFARFAEDGGYSSDSG